MDICSHETVSKLHLDTDCKRKLVCLILFTNVLIHKMTSEIGR